MAKHKHKRRAAELQQKIDGLLDDLATADQAAEKLRDQVIGSALMLDARDADIARLTAALRTIDRVTVTTRRLRGATDRVAMGIYKNAYTRTREVARRALGKD